jgi:4-carboxymuconolactone decarboxylase
MARVPYFDMSKAPAAYTELIGNRPPLNLYKMLPHAGPAAVGFLKLGGAILRDSELDPRLREVAILRVGMLSRANYEVHQHKRVANRVGLSDAKIAAIEIDADTSALDTAELQVLRFTDQLVLHVKAPDAMFHDMQAMLSSQALAELVLTIGFYMMVSRFLENYEVDIEPPGAVNF